MKVISFECKQDLTPYINSMLFDRHEVAKMVVESDSGDKLEITLEVRGSIKVWLNGRVYASAAEMPQELKNIILLPPDERTAHKNYEAEDENWFEYIYTDLQTGYSDGIIFSEDLATYVPDDIKGEMQQIATEYFEEL